MNPIQGKQKNPLNFFFIPFILAFILSISLTQQAIAVDVGTDTTYSNDLADNINFTADVSATLDNNVTITGNITTAVDNTGTLRFLGTGTITGTAGAADPLYLKGVAIYGAAGTTVTFGNNVFLKRIHFNDDGTLVINNAGGGGTLNIEQVTSDGNVGILKIGNNGGANTILSLTNNIGSSAYPIKELIFDEAGVNTLQIQNSSADAAVGSEIYANTIRFTRCPNTGCEFEEISKIDADTYILDNSSIFLDDTSAFTGTRPEYIGDFTTTADGQGTIRFNGKGKITGNIGTETLRLRTIEITATVDDTATNYPSIAGDIYLSNGIVFEDLDAGEEGKSLTLLDGSDLHANITSAAGNEGVVIFQGTHTIDGQLGTNANRLKGVYLGASTTRGTITLSQPIYTATAANGGTSINIAGIVGDDDDLVTAGTQDYAETVMLDANVSLVGETVRVDKSGIINTQQYTLAITGAYIHDQATELHSTILTPTAYGHVTSSDNATINADTDIVLDVRSYIPNNTSFTLIDPAPAGSAIPTLTGTITDNSLLTSFTQNTGVTDDLVIVASRATVDSLVSGDSRTSAIAQALDAAEAAGAMQNTIYALESLGSAAAVEEALETLNPNDSYAIPQATMAVFNQAMSAVTQRLASTRGTGFSSGSVFNERAIWATGFASFGEQTTRNGDQGYSFLMGGTAFGIDANVTDNTTVGMSWAFAHSAIDYDDFQFNKTKVDSNILSFYADYEYDVFYLDAAYSIGWHSFEGSRTVSFGGFHNTPAAEYDGTQNGFYVEGGATIEGESFDIIPMLALNFSHLEIDPYTETGGSEHNLTVDKQTYNIFETGMGIKISKMFERFDYRMTPQVYLMWFHDYIADPVEATARFTAGGTSFKTNGASPAADRLNLGSICTFEYLNNMDLQLSYDMQLKSRFYSHHGSIKLRYNF